MIDTDFISEVSQTIIQQKWRSLMTSFGVFWGILILILLLGAGMGMSNGIMGSITNIPANSIFFAAGETSKAYGGFPRGRKWEMQMSDVNKINSTFSRMIVSTSALKYPDRVPHLVSVGTLRGQYTLAGVTTDSYQAMPQKLLDGRYINHIDILEQRKVCVIGEKVAETLFPGKKDVIGKQIKVDNQNMDVVGIAKTTNKTLNVGPDLTSSILMPLSTEQVLYDQAGKVDILGFIFRDEYPVSTYGDSIDHIIRANHSIAPDDELGLLKADISYYLEMFTNLFTGVNILIWIVGIGTLLAGLIGISNIMLITVKERTQEIGVRRALGAQPSAIIIQIVCESMVLTAISGLLGIAVGVWVIAAVRDALEAQGVTDGASFINPYVPLVPAISAFVILILGGMLAGLMPAKRALAVTAMDALRDE